MSKYSLLAGTILSIATVAVLDIAPTLAADTEEIIVTARRRAESLQDVPISVTVLNAENLQTQGVARFETLTQAIPSVNTRTNAGRRDVITWEMRGIAASDSNLAQDAAVGLYVNEVVVSRTHGSNSAFFDVENVQALYGPQGTLFGRNTTGGAILVNTKKPTDKFEGQLGVTLGNFNKTDFNGVLNVPINENFAVRAAAKVNRRDGFVTVVNTGRDLDNEHNESWRFSVRNDFSDRFKNNLVYDGYHSRENGTPNFLISGPQCGNLYTLPSTQGPLTFNATAPLCGVAALVNAAYAKQMLVFPNQVYSNVNTFNRVDVWGVADIATYDITDNILVKNIFGYRKVRTGANVDIDATDAFGPGGGNLLESYQSLNSQNWSDELQLQGKSHNLDWTIGGYYFHENGRQFSESVQFQFGPAPWPRQTTDFLATNISSSLFAQGTYHIPSMEQLSLTGGFRYTWDKRSVTWQHANRSATTGLYTCRLDLDNNNVVDPDPAGPTTLAQKRTTCAATRTATYRQPTWTVSLDYKWTDRFLTYVAHRRGYHAGGFNGTGANAFSFSSFAPETINDIEGGFKSTFNTGSMPTRIDFALYHSWYKNLQRTVADPGPPATTIIVNAAQATITGFELNWSIRPVPPLELSGFYGFVDGKSNQYNDVCPAGTVGCVANSRITLINIPFNTSKHTIGVTLNYEHLLGGDAGTLNFVTNLAYRSFRPAGFTIPEPPSDQPAFALVNMNMAWHDIYGSGVDCSLWVRNLTDKVYRTGSVSISRSFGFTPATLGEPRTFGAELTYKFGS